MANNLHCLGKLAFALLSLCVGLLADDGYEVSQVHLAMGRSSSSMIVSWATPSAAGSDVFVSLTQDGSNAAHFSGSSTSYQFPAYSYSQSVYPAYSSPFMHNAVITGLSPGTTYYYRCGDNSTSDFSGMLQFTTMPAPGDAGILSFAVIGDLGMTNDSRATLNHMMMNPSLSMVLHAGDLSYADCDQTKWDRYGIMIEPLANSRPWMVGPGNHEIEFVAGDDGSGLYRSFENRYKMPWETAAQLGKITYQDWFGCCPSAFQSEYNYGNSFFSFDVGLSHIIYANTYGTTDSDSAQFKWLSKDLANVDRSVTPWVFVITHCPWYNSNLNHQSEFQAVQMRANLEALFYANKVNAVIAGHVHAYERTHPVYQNATVSDGIVYINIGDGGNAEGHDFYYESPAPAWSAYRNGTQFGHGELKILDAQRAVWTWYRNCDGEYVNRDEIEIANSAVLPPTPSPFPVSPANDASALGLFYPVLTPQGVAVIVCVGLLLLAGLVALARRWRKMQSGRYMAQAVPVDDDNKHADITNPITGDSGISSSHALNESLLVPSV